MTPSRGERTKANLIFFALCGVFILLGGRLYYIQYLRHAEYSREAERQTRTAMDVPAARGLITDRHGQPLALSVPAYLVAASLPDIADPHSTARKLSPLLKLSEARLLDRLTRDLQFVHLERRVPVETARAIERLQAQERKAGGPRPLAGIHLLPDSRRVYPCGRSACHLVGFTDIDNIGREGVERLADGELRGSPGKMFLRRDGRARPIAIVDERYLPARPGHRVVLTVDMAVQRALEKELAGIIERYGPLAVCGLAMEPHTGRLLAAASWPGYDPNSPGDSPPEARLNRIAVTVFEPGSTFKPFAAAMAIDEGQVQPTDRFFCENGTWRVRRRVITDVHGYGWLTLTDVIVKSSNIGIAKLGRKLGAERLSRYCWSLGFGRPTGLGLPGESGGVVRPLRQWTADSVLSVPFGHEISVNAVQLASGYAVLANGGTLYRPQLILRTEDACGRTVHEFPPHPLARVISPRTSSAMRAILREVVERGTGRQARLEEYAVAGKTGTTRKLVDGRYSDTKFISSFVGFAPAENPRLVALISVDEPRGAYYGGTVAGPAVAALLRTALARLGVPPRSGAALAAEDSGW